MGELLNKIHKEVREKAQDDICHVKVRVRCLNDGMVYSSLSQAAKETGCSKSHISDVCNGKLKTAKGLRFVFEDKHAIEIRKNKPKRTEKRKYVKRCMYLNHKKRYEEVEWSNQRAIDCWENGETYRSASEASRELGIPVSTILRNCRVNKGIEDDDLLKSTRSGWTFSFSIN